LIAITNLVLLSNRTLAAVEEGDKGYCGTPTFFNWECADSNDGIGGLLLTIFNVLAVGVTIAVVAGVIIGAVMYTSSGGNPEQAKKAVGVIRNSFIALLLYFAMWTLLNFLMPGGMFA